MPDAGVISVKGVLYGTTSSGGGTSCECGTVFSVDAQGNETTLYRFQGGQDGAMPEGALTYKNGILYGTTLAGGNPSTCFGTGSNSGCGTVFALSLDGKERVVYSFAAGTDGSNPQGDLVALNGSLYGVTNSGGGTCDCGTVFSMDRTERVQIVYRFLGGSQGGSPMAGLSVVGGTLYGTTTLGGGACTLSSRCGTVYSMTPSGTMRVLHRFTKSYGGYPWSNLVELHGTLYGTTYYGGAGCFLAGCGTIYSIASNGVERMVWLFGIGNDGTGPLGRLVLSNGIIYGATQQGGDYNCGLQHGCGTVFAFNPASGRDVVLHRFANSDGAWPFGGLRDIGGHFYGATNEGGASNRGTVFWIAPPIQ